MKLDSFEKYALQFLFDHSEELKGFDVESLAVIRRSDNPYARTIMFAHNEDEDDIESLSRLGGQYYLVHPIRDDIVDVTVDLANNVPTSVEIFPLGMDALPEDLADFVFEPCGPTVT